MSKSREQKRLERLSLVTSAPTPETAVVVTAEAPKPLNQRVDEALASGNHVDPALHAEVFVEKAIDLMGDAPPTSDTESAPASFLEHVIEAAEALTLDEAFLLFIRSPCGVDASDPRVRDVYEMEHRLKTAYQAGWEAARA